MLSGHMVASVVLLAKLVQKLSVSTFFHRVSHCRLNPIG